MYIHIQYMHMNWGTCDTRCSWKDALHYDYIYEAFLFYVKLKSSMYQLLFFTNDICIDMYV